MRAIATLISLMLIACAAPITPTAETGGGTAGTPDVPLHRMTAAQCQTVGGTMRPVCMRGTVQCVIRYSDAGRTCRDGDDCQGACRAENTNPPPGPTTGRCQETSDPCGCFANVEDGRIDGVMCVD
ncbi:MAG: hypothetical protein J0L52_02345 [Caulobacterales bacterium]|nr:hypothetical protein [Caulobacterales bacterium]